MRERLTDEELEFLRDGYARMRVPELARAFNARFGHDMSESAVKSTLTRNGFRSGRPKGVEKGRVRLLSEEQVAFIREQYPLLSRKDLVAALNARFGLSVSVGQLKSFIARQGITCGRTGRFEAGQQPWNTGTKGVCKSNSGTFRQGNVPGNLRPMGSERIDTKDGYVLVKVQERNPYTGAPTRFKAKHVVGWEDLHGPVPKGHVVRFKDGDKTNCAPENLELVRQAVNLRLNQMGYADAPAELKPVAMAIAEVEVRAFERQRGTEERMPSVTREVL